MVWLEWLGDNGWNVRAQGDVLQENILYATNDDINIENFRNYRKRSKVCLPEPCKDLDAYSGFIPVNADNTAFLFFLHIKSKINPARKPLLLWLQGSPGVSSLFGQFLSNGPLGIDADGKLYHRTYSLIRDFNVIYLGQPAGAGYSFSEERRIPWHTRRGVSTARAAIAVATYIDKKTDIPLRFKGLMLGVGLVFPLMDIVDSANFLHTSGLLDEYGRRTLASWFEIIRASVKRQELAKAADELFKTVFNMPPVGQKTIFQGPTGFDHHGSIARTRQPLRVQRKARGQSTYDPPLIATPDKDA
nr:venom serine carboxypeptidase-like [Rhipicephalus microplus]